MHPPLIQGSGYLRIKQTNAHTTKREQLQTVIGRESILCMLSWLHRLEVGFGPCRTGTARPSCGISDCAGTNPFFGQSTARGTPARLRIVLAQAWLSRYFNGFLLSACDIKIPIKELNER